MNCSAKISIVLLLSPVPTGNQGPQSEVLLVRLGHSIPMGVFCYKVNSEVQNCGHLCTGTRVCLVTFKRPKETQFFVLNGSPALPTSLRF